MFDTTMIHGRFQPFHNGHLDYLRQTMAITNNRLIIGITNPTPDLISEVRCDTHRHLPEANPYSYFQRYSMIHETLCHERDASRISMLVVPFPIHNEELWDYYVPKDVVQVLSAFEMWDQEKKARFEKHGYQTHELVCDRIVSGTQTRKINSSNQTLADYVPKGTLKVLRNLAYYG